MESCFRLADADNTGYSYAADFLSQWTIVWDSIQSPAAALALSGFFDFDRTTY